MAKFKVMWCVCISSDNTDIHGRIYCNDREDAIVKLKKAIASDLEKVKKLYPYESWTSGITESGMYGDIESGMKLRYENGDYESYWIRYMVKKMRTTV